MPVLPSATDRGEGRGDQFLSVVSQVGIADSGQQQQESFRPCPCGIRLGGGYEELRPREPRPLEASLQRGERNDRVGARRLE
jgi:hypothetical protein